MMNTISNTTPIIQQSLEELLASNCLSQLNFVLGNELSIGMPTEIPKSGTSLRHLNAAKVSLLLVKSVRDYRNNNNSGTALHLQIDDFVVKYSDNVTIIPGGCAPANNKQRDLLAVEIIPRHGGEKLGTIPDSDADDGSYIAKSPTKNIGHVLHALFANGDPYELQLLLDTVHTIDRGLPASVSPAASESDCDNWDGSRQNSKIRRGGEAGNSLFSTLLETRQYPVSVCRLLHDMLDERSDSYISSLDDAIQDLEQMSNSPDIYLYDQGHEFYSKNLRFGQGYYGRMEELTTVIGISNQIQTTGDGGGIDAVFVSGAAGSGKSYFVQYVSTFLSSSRGWIVLRSKFKRSLEYESRVILASLFERLISDIAMMTIGGSHIDRDYSQRVSTAISEALDSVSLSYLAKFIPSIHTLIPGVDMKTSREIKAELSHWQLVFLLSKLLGCILNLDRNIMLCMDDLQWCDSNTIDLISEVLISVSIEGGNHKLLFVGMYRDNEITGTHPFTNRLAVLKKSPTVNVAEIKLSSLLTIDVADMIMTEVRLPRRLVRRLATIIQNKTAGHAIFVVQLLNSLVFDSVIAYSPRKHRFDWNVNTISNLKMCDDVASLIVSNLSYVKPKSLKSLNVLSCFGVQIDRSLIKLLDRSPSITPQGGIEHCIPDLIERGILEVSENMVMFCHDLIQQNIYESVSLEDMGRLHLGIGSFLGSMTLLDASTQNATIEGGIDNLYLSDTTSEGGDSIAPQTLIHIATAQVNSAGPAFITDPEQRKRFSGWNYHAGLEAAENSNFQAALYNFRNGIAFLKDGLWLGDATSQLCRELHEGAAFSSFALGNHDQAETYASTIIDNVTLQDSLFAQNILIRTLRISGKYRETIARGLAILRLLKVDIPAASDAATVMQAMIETGKITSKYTTAQITQMKVTSINAKKGYLFKIADSVIVACYCEASPFLPLVTCALINYSMANGIVEESATAFVSYGYFNIFLSQNFAEGKHWGDIALEVLDPSSTFPRVILFGQLSFWFVPHRKIASTLFGTYENGMKTGDLDNARMALCFSLRFSLFGGDKLSDTTLSYGRALELMAKTNKEGLKYIIIDVLLLDALTGVDSNPFALFEGMLPDENVLLADFKMREYPQGIESIYLTKYFIAFWFGDYANANKWFDLASAIPSSRMPKLQLIYSTFYRGIISYQLSLDGKGEQWQERGDEILLTMGIWSKNCEAIYQNKLYLLQAESNACNCNIAAAKELFVLAATSARDNGLIHEQALACECYAKFLTSIVEQNQANIWFQQAYQCYLDWGANAKAGKLMEDNNLSDILPGNLRLTPDAAVSTSLSAAKHVRDGDEKLF
mmetsp:Transcript_32513/g.78696  ORF Transcript_32513/g.78696 Transcript_32513/m.78696 type:complete len:1338 (-) Transcript_32513:142-4155(-)|eukprot:CAMPEP_0181081518 /NCGR_PEP_ID=MMETSP1071-20121207/3142_1 /TAXON_ID=35127 /ORGANISM="Thalassiosira sp., Strain NH16" /LENGTH=1337 /DNA_ID=CAMNT_0023163065 /DNA_START=46 /DNA_END=4059 /DNA_ORIENTATION=+